MFREKGAWKLKFVGFKLRSSGSGELKFLPLLAS